MADDGKKRLGRGLAALLGDMAEETSAVEKVRETLRRIPLSSITANPRNPRLSFSESDMQELVVSIKQKGVLQPILVRTHPVMPGHYELIAGERRWRASQIAGLHEVPVVIQEVSDQESLELALIENVQRSDLNAIDEAMGYQQLIQEFEYKQDQVAAAVGKSRSYVANMLRILKLPASVQQMVKANKISAGHAKMLVGLDDAEALAQKIAQDGWSVRELEYHLQQRNEAKNEDVSEKSKNSKTQSPQTADLEQRISRALGLRVELVEKSIDTGFVKIHYSSLEQFQGFIRRLNIV